MRSRMVTMSSGSLSGGIPGLSHERGAEPRGPAPPFTWSDALVAAVHRLGTASHDGVAACRSGLDDGTGLRRISSRASGQENCDGQNELLHNHLR